MTTVNDAAPPPQSRAGRLGWGRCAVVVLAALAIGVTLSWLLLPMWLVPPYVTSTPYVHVLLVGMWIPALGICALRRPRGRLAAPALIATLALLASVFWCTLIGPTISVMSTEGGFSGTLTCDEPESLPGGRVRYTCRADYLTPYSAESFVLEGREGWPFARLVEVRPGGS